MLLWKTKFLELVLPTTINIYCHFVYFNPALTLTLILCFDHDLMIFWYKFQRQDTTNKYDDGFKIVLMKHQIIFKVKHFSRNKIEF